MIFIFRRARVHIRGAISIMWSLCAISQETNARPLSIYLFAAFSHAIVASDCRGSRLLWEFNEIESIPL